jgi:hypothetical protein
MNFKSNPNSKSSFKEIKKFKFDDQKVARSSPANRNPIEIQSPTAQACLDLLERIEELHEDGGKTGTGTPAAAISVSGGSRSFPAAIETSAHGRPFSK